MKEHIDNIIDRVVVLLFVIAFLYLMVFKTESINNQWIAGIIVSISIFILGKIYNYKKLIRDNGEKK